MTINKNVVVIVIICNSSWSRCIIIHDTCCFHYTCDSRTKSSPFPLDLNPFIFQYLQNSCRIEFLGVFALFCLYYVIAVISRVFSNTITVQLQIYRFSIKINLSNALSPHCPYLFLTKERKLSWKVYLARSC